MNPLNISDLSLILLTRGWGGKHLSEEHKRKIGLAHKGKIISPEQREKLRVAALNQRTNLFTRGRYSGELNHSWKGDNVKYIGLHVWVKKHIPKSNICFFCKQKKKLDLANMTGIYNRDFSNWEFICRGCHIIYDKRKKKYLGI